VLDMQHREYELVCWGSNKLGHGILVFDFKGVEHLATKKFALDCGRIGDIVEVGKAWGYAINPLIHMSTKEFEKFITGILGSNHNDWWTKSAIGLGMSIFNQLRTLEDIFAILPPLRSTYAIHFFRDAKREDFLSIDTIVKIVSSASSIKNWSARIYVDSEKESLLTAIKENIKTAILEFNLSDEDAIRILNLHEKFIQYGEESIQPFKVAEENSEAEFKGSGQTGIRMTLSTALGSINRSIFEKRNWQKEYLDITKELGAGKIVIVDVNGIGDITAKAIFSSNTRRLSGRTAQKDIVSISIFIDEAHRVLAKDMDLGIDVLRSSKVELFLALQTRSQLASVFGEIGFLSIFENLNRVYTFRNADNKNMKDYEYYLNEDAQVQSCEKDKIYFNEDELFEAELAFQQQIEAFRDISEIKSGNFIAKIDDTLFSRGRYSLQDSTGVQKEVFIPLEEVNKQFFEHFSCKNGSELKMKHKKEADRLKEFERLVNCGEIATAVQNIDMVIEDGFEILAGGNEVTTTIKDLL
jgi:hypothetical protein